MQERKVAELTVHKLSEEIYGPVAEENVSDLIQSIREYGILSPLVINAKGEVLSGNRRLRASRELGLETVPTETVELDSPESEQIYIIESNRQRVKTATVIVREGRKLEEIFLTLGKAKKLAALNHGSVLKEKYISNVKDILSSSAIDIPINQKMLSRTEIANALHIKERYWRAISFIDKYASLGNERAIELMAMLDKQQIAPTKAEAELRKALKRQSAGSQPEEESEPTYADTCAEAIKRHTRNLVKALEAAGKIPDEEFSAVKFMDATDDIACISTYFKIVDERIKRKMKLGVEQFSKELDANKENVA